MQIAPISFGKKIPLIKCKIRDNITHQLIPATFYQIDCHKDREDIKEISVLTKDWHFGKPIAENMEDVYMLSEKQKEFDTRAFYEMRTDNGEIVGICQIQKLSPLLKLEYLESKGDKQYKYVGQTMMASLGKVAKHEKLKKIYIPIPISSAINFYVDKCGFKPSKRGENSLYIKTSKADTLQKKVEANIHFPMIDLMERV